MVCTCFQPIRHSSSSIRHITVYKNQVNIKNTIPFKSLSPIFQPIIQNLGQIRITSTMCYSSLDATLPIPVLIFGHIASSLTPWRCLHTSFLCIFYGPRSSFLHFNLVLTHMLLSLLAMTPCYHKAHLQKPLGFIKRATPPQVAT